VIKTIVSIEVDLASSLAVRFACHLGSFLQMEIQPVYVKEFPTPESAVGSGWARHTWEKELLQEGREEISSMIMAEMDFCPILKEPVVVYGDHEAELLKLVENGSFDLYVEGVHFSWNVSTIHKQLHSKMHQRIQSPMVLVRSLRKVREVLVLCLDTTGIEAVAQLFQRIWQGCPVPLVLAVPASKAPGEERSLLEQKAVESAKILGQAGIQATVDAAFSAIDSEHAEQSFKDYGLVAMALERHIAKDCAPLQWMNSVKTSCLVALY
jgi:hypothetical protein